MIVPPWLGEELDGGGAYQYEPGNTGMIEKFTEFEQKCRGPGTVLAGC
ncbi:MAG TPA: hypothetical protein VGG46_03820 [Terriglobales bacterium]